MTDTDVEEARMTKLDEIAKSLGTYSVHQCRVPEGVTWWVLDRGNGPAFNSDDEAIAIKECALLNARAVLEALREPTEEMLEAGDNESWEPESETAYIGKAMCKDVWQAMIDELLKSE